MTWVFGYGSLMWNPGFEFEEKAPARLRGYHRWFSGISKNSRGTAEHPGMMLGLMPGGECVGAAYRITAKTREATLAYLDKREGEGRANRRVLLPVQMEPSGGATFQKPGQKPRQKLRQAPFQNAWVYLTMPSNENWVGKIPLAEALPRFCAPAGKVGTTYEYLERLLEELAAFGAREPGLEALRKKIDTYRAGVGGGEAKPLQEK